MCIPQIYRQQLTQRRVLYFPYSLLMIFHGVRGIMHPRPPQNSRSMNTKSLRIQAAIYFAFRYTAKLFQRVKPRSGKQPTQVVTREANGINQRSNIFTRLRRGEKSTALSLRVLPSNVLLKIASYTHYVDIVNLHTAYGSLFLTYIGDNEEESKLEELRMYSCASEQAKQECRLCRAQICEVQLFPATEHMQWVTNEDNSHAGYPFPSRKQ